MKQIPHMFTGFARSWRCIYHQILEPLIRNLSAVPLELGVKLYTEKESNLLSCVFEFYVMQDKTKKKNL